MDEDAPLILNYAPGEPRSLRKKVFWAAGIGAAIAVGGTFYQATRARPEILGGTLPATSVQWQNNATTTNPSSDNMETTP